MRQLADIISSKVAEIDAVFEKQGLDYPSLDTPFTPGSPSEIGSMAPAVLQCSSLIVAACAQLSATLNIPALTLYDISGGVSPCTSPAFSYVELVQ
jgi:hypothetical protein